MPDNIGMPGYGFVEKIILCANNCDFLSCPMVYMLMA